MEQRLECDLTKRKKEVDQLVMDFINEQSEEDNETSEEEEKPAKRASAGKKSAAKKRRADSDDSGDSGSEGKDDDYKPSKSAKVCFLYFEVICFYIEGFVTIFIEIC